MQSIVSLLMRFDLEVGDVLTVTWMKLDSRRRRGHEGEVTGQRRKIVRSPLRNEANMPQPIVLSLGATRSLGRRHG
ncbi:MAG: hypothetical protein ACI8TP_003972 [Acidimicrobiales bacterium]|jgi:hypothetical protein